MSVSVLGIEWFWWWKYLVWISFGIDTGRSRGERSGCCTPVEFGYEDVGRENDFEEEEEEEEVGKEE